MLTVEQLVMRAGLLTASPVSALYGSRRDGKETAARRDLRMRLAIERVTGLPMDEPLDTPDIRRGNELEPQARTAYEITTGRMVTECGFIRHETLLAGCTPDGMVGREGVTEFKCPRPATHFNTLTTGAIPEDYIPQVMHQLWVTGMQWADFVSYCPQMPVGLELVVIRHERNDAEIAAHELMVRQFLKEVDAAEAELRQLMEAKRG